MITERIKLIGNLPNEKEVDLCVLDINSKTPFECEKIVKEYSAIFPEITIKARKGDFKKIIPENKRKALSLLMVDLQNPFNNLLSYLN